jgi:hypothetical protein
MDHDRSTPDPNPTSDAFTPPERRRFARYGDPVPVPTLVDQSLRSAELQLLDAREALKNARRRVVQLEDALESWQTLRQEMTRNGSEAPRAAAN